MYTLIPPDKTGLSHESSKQIGIFMICAGVLCSFGVVFGVGYGSGNWAVGVAGACGLFFGLVCTGIYKIVNSSSA